MSDRRYKRENALTHWAITERDGREPDEQLSDVKSMRRCQTCNAEGVMLILHPDPQRSDPRRCICGDCQGRINATRAGMAPRETT
jgi:hypothetical protein